MRIFSMATSIVIAITTGAHAELTSSEVEIDFQQPPPSVAAAMEPSVVTLSDTEVDRIEKIGRYALIDGYPYFRYWQLGDANSWVRHPSALGGAMYELFKTNGGRLPELIDEAMKTAVSLRNGGLTWFYPEVYPLSRMVGPKVHYSALSQSTLLAATMHMARADHKKYEPLLRRVAKGIEYDYHQGGVLWQKGVFLELPLFYSPPEIILNGWLHALLNYGDYVTEFPNLENRAIWNRNIRYLVDLLPSFDDPENRISLYSNTTPLHLRVLSDSVPTRVDYVPLDKRFPKYSVSLREMEAPEINGVRKDSPFDTQITSREGAATLVRATCNALYETRIVSTKPIQASYSRGLYDPLKASPPRGEQVMRLEGRLSGDGSYVVSFNAKTPGVFCGYPTNFAKPGNRNLYHAYHVVALAYLGEHPFVNPKQRTVLVDFARRWDSYTRERETSGDRFYEYANVLSLTNSHKLLRRRVDWEKLRSLTIDSH